MFYVILMSISCLYRPLNFDVPVFNPWYCLFYLLSFPWWPYLVSRLMISKLLLPTCPLNSRFLSNCLPHIFTWIPTRLLRYPYAYLNTHLPCLNLPTAFLNSVENPSLLFWPKSWGHSWLLSRTPNPIHPICSTFKMISNSITSFINHCYHLSHHHSLINITARGLPISNSFDSLSCILS